MNATADKEPLTAKRPSGLVRTIGLGLDALAVPVLAVFAVPFAGGVLGVLFNWVREIAWRVLRLPALLADLAGLETGKTLRLRIIVLTAGRSRNLIAAPVMTEAAALAAITAASATLRDRFGIDAVVIDVSTAPLLSPSSTHRPRQGGAALVADCGWAGAYYQFAMIVAGIRGSLRRLIGYGAPVTVFVARHASGSELPVGAVMARDYVVLTEDRLAALPQAIAQAGGVPAKDNGAAPLGRFPRAWLRNSRFCTLF